AVDMPGEMLGQQAPLDIGRSAGGEVDDEREPLALVVGLVRASMRDADERRAESDHDGAQAEHRKRTPGVRARLLQHERRVPGMTARLALALCALVFAVPVHADPVADFYKGKTVTIVVSSSAAGGYDTIARAVARFMGRHLPGNPTFIVRNMPGAGGMT